MITYYASNQILNCLGGSTTLTVPGTWYFALSTSTPDPSSSTIAEPSGNGYARVAFTNTHIANWGTASSGIVTTLLPITFPESTGSWGTITYVCMLDSATIGAGNLWMYEAVTPRAISALTTVIFNAGGLSLQLTNA